METILYYAFMNAMTANYDKARGYMKLFMKRSEGTTDEHFIFWRKMIDQWFNGGDTVVMDFGNFNEVKTEIQEVIDGQKIDRDKLNITL